MWLSVYSISWLNWKAEKMRTFLKSFHKQRKYEIIIYHWHRKTVCIHYKMIKKNGQCACHWKLLSSFLFYFFFIFNVITLNELCYANEKYVQKNMFFFLLAVAHLIIFTDKNIMFFLSLFSFFCSKLLLLLFGKCNISVSWLCRCHEYIWII